MKKRILLSVIIFSLLSACATAPAAGRDPSPAAATQLSPTTPPQNTATPTRAVVIQPSPSPAQPSETASPQPTPSPEAAPTPEWHKQGPYKVVCPILLYHQVATPTNGNLYYVDPVEFRAQMQALKDWGYTSIPVALLIKAINFGAKLPPRPVVITFDDGGASVYSSAFPIMQEFGFTGVSYIIYNYVGTKGYMTAAQIQEMAAAGWETGSHSLSHADLTVSDHLEWEVNDSRYLLEKLLGVRVETFAYPYGKANFAIRDLVRDHYRAGMGLGVYLTQRSADLYYLWRRPVEPGWDLTKFGSFLPWNSPPQP